MATRELSIYGRRQEWTILVIWNSGSPFQHPAVTLGQCRTCPGSLMEESSSFLSAQTRQLDSMHHGNKRRGWWVTLLANVSLWGKYKSTLLKNPVHLQRDWIVYPPTLFSSLYRRNWIMYPTLFCPFYRRDWIVYPTLFHSLYRREWTVNPTFFCPKVILGM